MRFQVDISTMLEEAVQYVKFLQLQIKVVLVYVPVKPFAIPGKI